MTERTPDLYGQATARNIGLISEAEQEKLRHSTVAIAGMGAVGGNYVLTLARLGVQRFIIADGDVFEPANLHRQAGAFTSTLGRNKAEVMAEMARDINPKAEIRVFQEPVTESNVDAFLNGADVVVDGIDFFQMDARRMLFRKAREKELFVLSSGPMAYGATLQVFDPHGMSFDEYFGIRPDMTRAQRLACFMVGLLSHLPKGRAIDMSRVDIEGEKGPALAPSVMLCAGIMGLEVLRVLLKRNGLRCVPHVFYCDPLGHTFARRCHRRGLVRWLDKLRRRMIFRHLPALTAMHRREMEQRAPADGLLNAAKI